MSQENYEEKLVQDGKDGLFLPVESTWSYPINRFFKKKSVKDFIFFTDTVLNEAAFIIGSLSAFILPAFVENFKHLLSSMSFIVPVWVGITAGSFFINGIMDVIRFLPNLVQREGEKISINALASAKLTCGFLKIAACALLAGSLVTGGGMLPALAIAFGVGFLSSLVDTVEVGFKAFKKEKQYSLMDDSPQIKAAKIQFAYRLTETIRWGLAALGIALLFASVPHMVPVGIMIAAAVVALVKNGINAGQKIMEPKFELDDSALNHKV